MSRTFWIFEKCSELGYSRSEETEMNFRFGQDGMLEKGKKPKSFEEALHSAKLANQEYNQKHHKKRELEMIAEYDEFMMLKKCHTL